jgi:hypothetical protein
MWFRILSKIVPYENTIESKVKHNVKNENKRCKEDKIKSLNENLLCGKYINKIININFLTTENINDIRTMSNENKMDIIIALNNVIKLHKES